MFFQVQVEFLHSAISFKNMNVNLSGNNEVFNTLARFDDNITDEYITDSYGKKSHSRHYHTFFLHVLLENVCKDIEPDEQKRVLLFDEVRKKLSETKFLNESLALDSLLPLRRKLAQQFFNFVKQIHAQVVPDSPENSITADSFLEETDFSTKVELQYKYEQNFQELEEIARGGFGVVCKARHKVTDIVYAVKKIIFKYKNDSEYLKVIREAQNIAAMNHANIVRYNNAWIECQPPSKCESSGSSSKSTSSSSDSDDSEVDDLEDHISEDFHAAIGKEDELSSIGNELHNRLNKVSISQRSSSTVIFDENYSQSEDSSYVHYSRENTSNCTSWSSVSAGSGKSRREEESSGYGSNESKSWMPTCLNVRVMLCIQMEYCDCDLRLWLNRRAEKGELPFELDVMRIFKDILNGVVHIHCQNIIHRDLKPQNIFFSKASNVLKIGDFGLATLTSCSTDKNNGFAASKHSANLGTLPYAAPEQIRYKSYDSKVDIYSLGIILIELLNEFSTYMEFSKAIDEILKGHFPKEMEKRWPMHINLVKNLVKNNPEDRMSAKEILSQLHILENSESNEISKLKVVLAEKEEEINRLRALVQEQENIINQQKIELGQ